jgi:hypothetical protein
VIHSIVSSRPVVTALVVVLIVAAGHAQGGRKQ